MRKEGPTFLRSRPHGMRTTTSRQRVTNAIFVAVRILPHRFFPSSIVRKSGLASSFDVHARPTLASMRSRSAAATSVVEHTLLNSSRLSNADSIAPNGEGRA